MLLEQRRSALVVVSAEMFEASSAFRFPLQGTRMRQRR